MYKMFCDCCGKEISHNFVGNRLKIKEIINKTDVEAEVMIAINGIWNGGHICPGCLAKVLKDSIAWLKF